jgi:hypothetical protein
LAEHCAEGYPVSLGEITTPWKAHGTDLLIVYNQNGLGDESGA